MNTTRIPVTVALLALFAAGCSRSNSVSLGGAQGAALPPDQTIERLPLGDLAGVAPNTLATGIADPYAGNPAAIRSGQVLFTQMNCVGCHAYDATGGMGPDLTDRYWRYGGAPAQVFSSIFEGRPKGMPAWGQMLPEEQIWKIVAYLETLGGMVPPKLAAAALQGNVPHEFNSMNSMKGMQAEDQP